MLARGLITLLALACIMAGAEAVETGSNAPELAYGKLIRTLDLQYTESLAVVVMYLGGNETFSTSNLTLDPGKRYTLFLVEVQEN